MLRKSENNKKLKTKTLKKLNQVKTVVLVNVLLVPCLKRVKRKR